MRQVNQVRLFVLSPGLGQCPNLTIEVKFVPRALRNLFAALASQGENLDDPAVRPPDFTGSDDHPSQLIVTKYPISGSLLGRQWDPIRRGLIQHRSPHAPSEECLNRLQRLVGGNRRTAMLDTGNHLNDVPLLDPMNTPVAPGGADLTTQ